MCAGEIADAHQEFTGDLAAGEYVVARFLRISLQDNPAWKISIARGSIDAGSDVVGEPS